MVDVRILDVADEALFQHVAEGVFDFAIQEQLRTEFLNDPRHHICVAVENGTIVGMVTAVHYVHPDKTTELWINEVAVAPTHHRRGIGKAMLAAMLAHAQGLGCTEAWVLTDEDNDAGRALYRSAGGTESHGVVMVSFALNPSVAHQQ